MQSFVSQCKVTIYSAKEKHDQRKIKTTGNFKEDQDRLNLQKNGTGIYECRGRVQNH